MKKIKDLVLEPQKVELSLDFKKIKSKDIFDGRITRENCNQESNLDKFKIGDRVIYWNPNSKDKDGKRGVFEAGLVCKKICKRTGTTPEFHLINLQTKERTVGYYIVGFYIGGIS